ncbi:RES family NAD+ phosphorylase [Marinobacter sp. SS8-8]|uniref:RES family NAD+ phosphorylase n=1 Tax=Marinobacter sp. SS8-8 TaxID=3050452 RepID=UPI0034A177B7
MPLFRIAPEKFLENYTGLGGSFEDGARWNLPQTPVMYFGLTASVAMLEMANYTASPRKVPPFCRLGLQDLDDDAAISELIESDLPEDWSVFPCPESTQETGNQWLQPDSPPAGGRPGHCSAAPPAGARPIRALKGLIPTELTGRRTGGNLWVSLIVHD